MSSISQWNDLIGNTPLIRLENFSRDYGFNLFAKLEMFNSGGSMKDRPARRMVEAALREGLINTETTIVESSSGNMGIGLAQACLKYGLRFICVVDPNASATNIRIIKAYGARIEMIDESGKESKSFLERRLARVKELLNSTPNSFWPNQYANAHNAEAHHATIREIDEALEQKIDFLFCATGTCGTIRGCSDYLKKEKRNTKVVGVDAYGSAIFRPKTNHRRLVPGHGTAIQPALHKDTMADVVVYADDMDCIIGCRRLLNEEVVFGGGSSGAVISAVEKLKDEIPRNANVVLILGDRGERYLDTIYNDEWVSTNFRSQSKIKEVLHVK